MVFYGMRDAHGGMKCGSLGSQTQLSTHTPRRQHAFLPQANLSRHVRLGLAEELVELLVDELH